MCASVGPPARRSVHLYMYLAFSVSWLRKATPPQCSAILTQRALTRLEGRSGMRSGR